MVPRAGESPARPYSVGIGAIADHPRRHYFNFDTFCARRTARGDVRRARTQLASGLTRHGMVHALFPASKSSGHRYPRIAPCQSELTGGSDAQLHLAPSGAISIIPTRPVTLARQAYAIVRGGSRCPGRRSRRLGRCGAQARCRGVIDAHSFDQRACPRAPTRLGRHVERAYGRRTAERRRDGARFRQGLGIAR